MGRSRPGRSPAWLEPTALCFAQRQQAEPHGPSKLPEQGLAKFAVFLLRRNGAYCTLTVTDKYVQQEAEVLTVGTFYFDSLSPQ